MVTKEEREAEREAHKFIFDTVIKKQLELLKDDNERLIVTCFMINVGLSSFAVAVGLASIKKDE